MPDQPSNIELSSILLLNATRKNRTSTGDQTDQEQLIALTAGDLDMAEREEILAAVATDDNLYHRWLALLETSAELELTAETEAGTATERQKPTLLGQITAWWESYRLTWLAVPALAASLVIMTLSINQTQLDTNQLYNRWEQGLQPTLGESYLGFRGDQNKQARKTAEQQWFEWGMHKGLKRLGENHVITGLPTYKLQQDRPVDPIPTGESLSVIGEVTVLTYFYCQQNMSPAFLKDTLEIVRPLENISEEWTLVSDTLSGGSENSRDLAKAVCTRTNALIKRLILLDD